MNNPVTSRWNGFRRVDFVLEGINSILVRPDSPQDGLPWIWRTEFFDVEPQSDIELLRLGFHVAYIDLWNLYGAPEAIRRMDLFYRYLTDQYQLAKHVCLVGISRGGLPALNWTIEHPEKVSCLYLDAPVCDIRSWPQGQGKGEHSLRDWELCQKAYGFAPGAEVPDQLSPLARLQNMASHPVPILCVCGDSDLVVPFPENSMLLQHSYRALGGPIEVILKKGCGHHPHSLVDPQPIVKFVTFHSLKI